MYPTGSVSLPTGGAAIFSVFSLFSLIRSSLELVLGVSLPPALSILRSVSTPERWRFAAGFEAVSTDLSEPVLFFERRVVSVVIVGASSEVCLRLPAAELAPEDVGEDMVAIKECLL